MSYSPLEISLRAHVRVARDRERAEQRFGRTVSVCSYTGYDLEADYDGSPAAALGEGPPTSQVLASTRSKVLLEWNFQQVDGIQRRKKLHPVTGEVTSITWDLTLHPEEERHPDMAKALANWKDQHALVPDDLLREVAPELAEVWRDGMNRALLYVD